ncbi:MAG: lysophospholipid acyltransferase (LPLAT)-like uncharacterized protein [Gammaproteobacteria bacterium]|jgi:lysophospholipid acyltransferase (LPLAT)-like uncharacterized protein
MKKSKKKSLLRILLPLMRLWFASWRFSGSLPMESPSILLMWHEELLPVLKCGAHQDWIGITSASRDGDQLAALITTWGYGVVRGSASTHKQAVKMLRETISIARDSKMCIGIDGPRGPRRQVKIGMLLAAQKTGVPITLVRVEANSIRLEKSWDKAIIPYPFSCITINTSNPIIVDKSLGRKELEALGITLTEQLNQLGPSY